MRLILAAIGLAAVLAGCAPAMELTPPPPAMAALQCQKGSMVMSRVELIFGTRWKGGPISQKMWRRFLADEVTPRFPDGLSTFDITGQWRNAKGQIVKLPSRILLIWYSPAPEAGAKIDAIRDAFNKRFDQESVMRVDGQNCVGF